MKSLDIIFGIDVGGTSIKFGAVRQNSKNFLFEILYSFTLTTGSEISPDAVIENIIQGIINLKKKYPQVSKIGIGMPGVINAKDEVCYPPNFKGWKKIPLRKILLEKLSHKTITNQQWQIEIENDANTAAIAELKHLSQLPDVNTKKISNNSFLFVTLGTGVGGCIISDGKIFKGKKGGAGELGHVSIDYSGNKCKCGSQGCIESYIGQRYMSAQALEIALSQQNPHKNSLLLKLSKKKDLDPAAINYAAEHGDKFAIWFLKSRGAMLGAALASAMNLLDIHEVVIGGGTAQSNILVKETKAECKKRLLKTIQPNFNLRLANYLTDSGVIGAAALVI